MKYLIPIIIFLLAGTAFAQLAKEAPLTKGQKDLLAKPVLSLKEADQVVDIWNSKTVEATADLKAKLWARNWHITNFSFKEVIKATTTPPIIGDKR